MAWWLIALIAVLTAPLWLGVLWMFWTLLNDLAGPADGHDGKGRVF